MYTLVAAAVLVMLIVIVCFLFIGIDKRQKRKAMNKLLDHFSRLGSMYHLKFSSEEILPSSVIGLDGVHRKLLVLSKDAGSREHTIIDLNKVKTCLVKKEYGTIRSGQLKNSSLNSFLKDVSLQFTFDDRKPVEVLFYSQKLNHAAEARALEKKARHWEVVIRKLQSPQKNTA